MRARLLVLALVAGAPVVWSVAWPIDARAQVTDAERSAARDLFKQGDELQRAGKYADALDKFQRAQQVIQAPTNVLRIAECQAALGKLVEAAEAYRTVTRWALTPESPPAFKSAMDQAKGELGQVEPRVPHLLVQVSPSGVASESLVIDGTAVPTALIGEPIPLDPGEHKVLVTAPGYASPEQTVKLAEKDSKTLSVTLRAGADAPPPLPAPSASSSSSTPPPPPPAYGSSSSEPPAPEVFEPASAPKDRKDARGSLLLGLHLGLQIPAGKVPITSAITPPNGSNPVDFGDVSGPGLNYGLDLGVRFLDHWVIGVSLDHAQLAAGKTPGNVSAGDGTLGSNTSSLGIMGAFIAQPDRPTFIGEFGLQERWYSFYGTGTDGVQSYTSGELTLGAGMWIPIGRAFKLVPLASVAAGAFQTPGDQTGGGGPAHVFITLGVTGYYGINL